MDPNTKLQPNLGEPILDLSSIEDWLKN